MPLFVLSCTDNEGTVEKRIATRPAHVARLEQLNDEGRLIVAGALPKDPNNPQAGFYGSTIIVDFESREAVEAWVAEEPFLKEGIYSHIDIKSFNKAFPKG
ncbi:YciI family protein [Acinetobacter portensis]|uniref:YciI family protein n=2 Tax=Acinetobacter TaxID=469 RepID=A0AB35UW52_9GAMM|nr:MULTISPECIES: YciI family protein [Acinetobacter]MCK7608169.1 YciI family protein [Acinetobacter portensis]MCK7638865.1 YciI family protein [Acinetobacter portensis]MDY6451228.1 YciI family protein [Acinetobacter faecalis]MDY6457974.1 YciI family protein [Acinetobacter faecalis]MDY6460258.1 YciI family protein [Acinetobacter faecalis]